MQRWKMTAGLTGLALAAIAIAPRLTAALQVAPAPPVPTPPPPSPVVAAPIATSPSGHLEIDVRLDQTAAMAHATSERFVTIDVRAPAPHRASDRLPVDLAVVLDTSGSMNEGKLDQAKTATRQLAAAMGPDDTFSLITFADRARVVHHAGPADVAALDRLLDRVWDYGGTNLYQGMSMAADEVARRDGAVQRMVVLSDGQPTTGRKDDGAFEDLARQLAGRGVSVSTVGLGLDFNEDLLSSIADLSGGSYDFVGDAVDLGPVFAEELQETATVVARDTRVQLALPDGVEGLEVIGWTATQSSGGWSVYLGDVAAGSHTRIVAKVQVRDDAALGPLTVAATATYADQLDERRARDEDQATLLVTTDGAAVNASIDAEAAGLARRAYGHWYLLMSTRAYADGGDATPLLDKGRDVIVEASRYAPEVAQELDRFDDTQALFDEVAPSHPRARERIKANKERYRAVFR